MEEITIKEVLEERYNALNIAKDKAYVFRGEFGDLWHRQAIDFIERELDLILGALSEINGEVK